MYGATKFKLIHYMNWALISTSPVFELDSNLSKPLSKLAHLMHPFEIHLHANIFYHIYNIYTNNLTLFSTKILHTNFLKYQSGWRGQKNSSSLDSYTVYIKFVGQTVKTILPCNAQFSMSTTRRKISITAQSYT